MQMKNRIDKVFADCRSEGRTALVAYLTAGDPCMEASEKLLRELVIAGADIIEVGVPFSDPTADGPTIQAAAHRALQGGTVLEDILQMIERIRKDGIEVPIVLFSYYNILYNYGVEALAKRTAEIGVDAWLTVDVPFEEQGEIEPHLSKYGMYSIPLLSPATPKERAEKILRESGGFAYYITVKGVTGARTELPDDLAQNVKQICEISPIPVAAGFGISTPEMAKEVSRHADAVVVGSALVKLIGEGKDWKTGIIQGAEFIRSLKEAMDS